MELRQTVRPAEADHQFLVIISCRPEARAQGKFIVARDPESNLCLIFDDVAPFHKDIALKYGVRPLGGGWCVLDQSARTLTLSGRSTQFGREPNRRETLSAFAAALPGYACEEKD